MPLDLQALMAQRRSEKFELFERYLNGPLVRVLRVLGYDADYVRGEGPYLFDAAGNRYLDLLSGFGVRAERVQARVQPAQEIVLGAPPKSSNRASEHFAMFETTTGWNVMEKAG